MMVCNLINYKPKGRQEGLSKSRVRTAGPPLVFRCSLFTEDHFDPCAAVGVKAAHSRLVQGKPSSVTDSFLIGFGWTT